jgi:hypothetical protein
MKCDHCGKEMTKAKTCHFVAVVIGGEDFSPLPWDGPHQCHDCKVQAGGYHHPGCDMERCPKCQGQLISCGCLDGEEGEED